MTRLDLSHNSILTLGEAALAGLPSLTELSLAHNHLQVSTLLTILAGTDCAGVQAVAGSWLLATPHLSLLSLADNDITAVEAGPLSTLHNLAELGLAGNPLACDCQVGNIIEIISKIVFI